jgi:hypothetical protein
VIVLNTDKNNIQTAIDIVQMKYIVSLLREVTEEQLILAAKEIFDSGFDDGDPVSAMAAAKSFVNVIGFYTDKVENPALARKQQTQPELADEETIPELSIPPKRYLN